MLQAFYRPIYTRQRTGNCAMKMIQILTTFPRSFIFLRRLVRPQWAFKKRLIFGQFWTFSTGHDLYNFSEFWPKSDVLRFQQICFQWTRHCPKPPFQSYFWLYNGFCALKGSLKGVWGFPGVKYKPTLRDWPGWTMAGTITDLVPLDRACPEGFVLQVSSRSNLGLAGSLHLKKAQFRYINWRFSRFWSAKIPLVNGTLKF